MNPTEPNSVDLTAIAIDGEPSSQPPQNLGTFLDRLYGTLFLPQATFEQLKAQPSFMQAAIVIGSVNILEILRLDQVGIFSIIWSVISGVIGWVFFTFLLKLLASVFQKQVSMLELLTLTGFASLPWLLMAPALSLPSQFRIVAAIAVIIWFIIWQVRSASIALEINSWRTLAIIPLAILGGLVALVWLSNTLKLILSITF
ncbi:YIP1 family protein [Pseudanabaena mucicola]|uniref:YIP1 family protein n=1 Tax=Pseudanabaena mucicola FACHB-723 TaxID=2692860 RepID=A0ABR7ZZZ1_9CYAN|nr:YIP1 family protein [Pseudanabaena mucicola]MBD2189095.1 YIP1 family protein [Pseudanabaena mucicola FACHB-723]